MRRLALILTGLLLAAAPASASARPTTWKTGRQREQRPTVLTMPRAERAIIGEVRRIDQPRTVKIARCWWLQRIVVRCWVSEINVPGISIKSGGLPVTENELDWQWTAILHRGHVRVQTF